ncbi:hypothetical protein SASPL_145146 [Salvia splendens]|uniref:BED-type domain-containing protein n=1 Tax=Salvia splendens TaxID=180675 RepID=A0A8X8Z743_SALSN|nr:hypothetical protein SASPL_145146 [Salvia splendens]
MESEDSHTVSEPNLPISESPNTSTNDDGSSRKRPIEVEGATDKPPLPPPKRSRSPYWEHCKKETKDTSSGKIQIGVCNYCKTEIPAICGSTSGLKNHLVNRCKLSPLFDVSSEKGQSVLTKETMQQGSRIVPHSFSQKRCELKMTQYVIKEEVCFRAIEKPGFVALVNEFEPRFQMPNRKKVAVPMDVKTRWNSTYKLLDIALKYRIVFERMAEECVPFIKYFRENDEKGRAKMLPSAEDWDNAKAFVHFLKNFYDLTLQLKYKGVNDTVLNQTPLIECEDVGDSSNKGFLFHGCVRFINCRILIPVK